MNDTEDIKFATTPIGSEKLGNVEPLAQSNDEKYINIDSAVTNSSRSTIVTSIEQLPDDCLLQIFEHLSMYDQLNARRVCIRWYHLLEDSIRRGPDIELKISHQIDLSPLGQPHKGFRFFPIRHQFTRAELAEHVLTKVLKRYVNRIVKIEFSMVLIGSNALVNLVGLCSRLETLIVHECNLNRCPNELESAVRLIQNRLRVLSLESNIKLNAEGLMLLEAPELQYLNLKGTMISSRHYEQAFLFGLNTTTVKLSLYEPPIRVIEKLIERSGTSLEHLELDDDNNQSQWALFEPQPCVSRLAKLNNLTTLVISAGVCDFISDLNNTNVSQLLKSCRFLKKLSICPRYRNTHSMTGQLLESLPRTAPNLRHLKFTSIPDLTAQRIEQLQYLSNLETVSLDSCSISWTYSMEEVHLFSAPIIQCCKLRSLSFECLTPPRDKSFWDLVRDQYISMNDTRLRTFELKCDRLDLVDQEEMGRFQLYHEL